MSFIARLFRRVLSTVTSPSRRRERRPRPGTAFPSVVPGRRAHYHGIRPRDLR